MRGEFFEALVVRIRGQEKRSGIRGVEHDEDAQLRGTREERIQPRIIDSQQRAIAIMQPQAQVFPDLHADGARGYALLQPVDRALKEAILIEIAPVHPRDSGEAARAMPREAAQGSRCRPCPASW